PQQPGALQGIEERLTSRLGGGLVSEIQEPDRDVRRAIIERVPKEQHGSSDAAVFDYLTDRPAESVRGRVAQLQRVTAAAASQDQPVTAALAREVLEGQPREPSRKTGGLRTSGVVVSSLGGIRSREKMVWDWPVSADRL